MPIRWHSTFYMLDRFTDLEEAIRTTIALLDKDLSIITNEEWAFFKEVVRILKPVEMLTTYMSGQNYVTASSIIILTNGVKDTYTSLKNQAFTELSKKLIQKIIDGFMIVWPI